MAAFLTDAILRLPSRVLQTPISTGLLICIAGHWVWREHARQQPLSALVYQTMGSAVRALLKAGGGEVSLAPGNTDTNEWLADGTLTGRGSELVTAEDLTNLMHLGGWRAELLRGPTELEAWIRRWLAAVPERWTRGPWPGCSLRLVLDTLVTQAHADAPKTHSIEIEGWIRELADSRGREPAPMGAQTAFATWLEREALADGGMSSAFARRFFRAIRNTISERTNRPRRRRCTRLALWMFVRLRESFDAELAALSTAVTGDERREAIRQIAREQIDRVMEAWPPETELAIDFYRPRFKRGLFPAVEHTQQTEDRDLVRNTLLRQLEVELR